MRNTFALACMALIGMWAADARGVIIDDFNGNPQALNVLHGAMPQDTDQLNQSGVDILKDERDVVLELDVSSAGDEASVRANTGTLPASLLSLASDPGVEADLTIVWDGADGSATGINHGGLMSTDLTDGGISDGFVVTAAADFDVDLLLTVYTNAGTYSEGTLTVTAGPMRDFLLAFDDFTPISGGGALFDNVGAIELFVDGVTALDFSIDLIKTSTIPEPSALAIWGVLMGLGATCGWRRRRVARV